MVFASRNYAANAPFRRGPDTNLMLADDRDSYLLARYV